MQVQIKEREARWARWMTAAQAGDQVAYTKLLTELGEVIERYLTRRFGAGHFIEDCVQESLLSLHNARHTYDPARPFQPWMFTVVRHKAIDWLRRSRRLEAAAEQLSSQPEMVAAMDGTDGDHLGGCFAKLGDAYRQALILTKVYGYSTAEAAAKAQISETAMKVRVHRGIRKMRKLLEEVDA